MTTWFVSRHEGAIAWAKGHKLPVDRWVEHLDAQQIVAGDTVIGTLPVHIAADICSRGARFFFLELHLELNQRGKELTESDMLKANCSVREYFVRPVSGN